VHGGSSYSLAVSKSRHVYYFGKMATSPGGEATVYPKIQQELYDWGVHSISAGGSAVFAASKDVVIAWGAPVAGKFGVEGGGKNCSTPHFVESLKGLRTLSVSCGYGHCAMLVSTKDPSARERLRGLPELTREMVSELSPGGEEDNGDSDGGSGKKKGNKTVGKKRSQASTNGSSAAAKKGKRK